MTELEKHMESLVKDYHKSSLTQEAFASRHGISKGKLHYWMKKFFKLKHKEPVPEFIPLEVPLPARGSKCIVIRMADGMEIQIPV